VFGRVKTMNIFKIHVLLSDKTYYSLSLSYLSKLTGIPVSDLRKLDKRSKSKLALDFESIYNDHINIFIYNNVEYIGLETRRIAYEIDKQNGTNWVEDAIKKGVYD
jgi:hypothetical protein